MSKRGIKISVAIATTCIFIGGGEICLRHFGGMTSAPLYYESDEYEYMVCPSQEGVRFMNKFYFNSFSQRSAEPDSTKTIILGLGDSVIYGGVMIDQDSIATEIFSRITGMQMLNISAGSWGPDNCAAYLKHYGLFGAKAIFLVVSSHDAHDNMTFQKVVGVSASYPDKRYKLGWWELIERYAKPQISKLVFAKRKDNKQPADPDQDVLNGIGINKGGGGGISTLAFNN